MYYRKNKKKSCLFLVILICGGILFCGSCPGQAEDFKEKIRKELEKIREYSPKVKLQRLWLKEFREAKAARQKALMDSAETFSKDGFENGEYLLNLSRNYAKKREFRKAEYLARKAKEAYIAASKEAKKNLAQALKKRTEEIKALEKKIKMLPKARAPEVIHSLELKMIMLNDALRAQDLVAFDQLKAHIKTIIKRLNNAPSDK